MLGNGEEEGRLYRKVLELAIIVGNRERAAVALNNLGTIADENGNMEEAKAHYLQALDLAQEIGAQQSQALYLVNIGHSELKLKDYENAKLHLREGMTIAERIGAQPWLLMGLMFYAQLKGSQGDKKEGLTLLGVAKNHHAFSADHLRMFEQILSEWGENPSASNPEIQAGASLVFENVIRDVIKQTTS
jgi:tetratricopeptide (TPR) repeat protein